MIKQFILYSCLPYFKEAALKLSHGTHLVLSWFKINSIVKNPGKCKSMFLGSNTDNSKITFMIENNR